jgi:hypothetical protein
MKWKRSNSIHSLDISRYSRFMTIHTPQFFKTKHVPSRVIDACGWVRYLTKGWVSLARTTMWAPSPVLVVSEHSASFGAPI